MNLVDFMGVLVEETHYDSEHSQQLLTLAHYFTQLENSRLN